MFHLACDTSIARMLRLDKRYGRCPSTSTGEKTDSECRVALKYFAHPREVSPPNQTDNSGHRAGV